MATGSDRSATMAGVGAPARLGSLGGMVRSVGLVIVLVVGLVVLFPRHNDEAVRVVDYTSSLEAARDAAPYPVLAPADLPQRWRATSVRYDAPSGGTAHWHLGFLTPTDEYAGVEQGDGDPDLFVDVQTNRGRPDGTVVIDGREWERYRQSARGVRSLVRRHGGSTVVVTGTAGYPELETLAGALR